MCGVVVRDATTDWHTSKRVEQREYRIKYFATDILKINIDTIGTSSVECLRQIVSVVADASIETEFRNYVVTFFLLTGNAYYSASRKFRKLSHDRTDRTRGR